METFKIANFLNDYPGMEFPPFRHLSSSEAIVVHQKWAEKIGIAKDVAPLELSMALNERCSILAGVNAASDNFALQEVLRELGIAPSDLVYLNWYRYDDVDELRVDDLSKNFEYVWYPSVDDIEIFDASFSWILAVSHDGLILFWKADQA